VAWTLEAEFRLPVPADPEPLANCAVHAIIPVLVMLLDIPDELGEESRPKTPAGRPGAAGGWANRPAETGNY
jgi:hypothetical protein